jgi:dTDP-4-dehydrorhamnose reductase
MTPRLLITGTTGHLGRTTAERATAAWRVTGTYVTPRAAGSASGAVDEVRLDIRDRDAVAALIRRIRPDVVIHTAAGRDDWRVMADGAAHVALAAEAAGARLVHVSTEAVFSGRDVHYDEEALPDPIYRYGAAKAAAETAVRAISPTAAVIRTSLIIGHGRGGHETLTHALIAGTAQGALFTDQIRKPVHVDDLADALLEIATTDHAGTLNVAGTDPVSRYDLGVLVATRDGLDPTRIPAATAAALPTPLPIDIRLTTAKAESLLKTRLRGAREFLAPEAK